MDTKHILRPAAITLAALLIPLVAMRFSDEVQWTGSDFAVAGVLIFVTLLVYELAVRRISSTKHRILAGIALAAAFVLIWAQLAVGIFSGDGRVEQNNQNQGSAKINIDEVCAGALAYMTFPSSAEADAFLEECKEGKRPEVIERYKQDMGLGEGAAI